MKKVLVLGGTGAMGQYLVPMLAEMNYQVDVVSLDKADYSDPRITHIQANAKDESVITSLLQNHYDGIVDFLIYLTDEFRNRHKLLLSSTSHYIYFSSYRIYANEEIPIREASPRLLDVSGDQEFLATEDYALYKARGENILRASSFTNWTIVRPAITYSGGRLQLTTLELPLIMNRIIEKKPIVLPAAALDIEGTMSWAGDVAKMLSRLLFNEKAKGEAYSVCTAEHHTWREIAEMYREICGLRYIAADTEDYLDVVAGPDAPHLNRMHAYYQLAYDRCFTRIMDNQKILDVTGMKQSELMPLRKGLELECSRTIRPACPNQNQALSDRMDAYLKGRNQ